MTKEWRCFHCDEVFKDFAEAELHFGTSCYDVPICQITAAEVRGMELQLRRYSEEDTDLHREIARLKSDHATALQREEEKGYAKGLRDAGYGVAKETLGLVDQAAESQGTSPG